MVKPTGGSELFLATQTVDQPRDQRLAVIGLSSEPWDGTGFSRGRLLIG